MRLRSFVTGQVFLVAIGRQSVGAAGSVESE